MANETLEDYSLRYAPKSFRKWPEYLIANTAIGSISFLALEAIGATIAIHYGFSTAFWAILTASIIIFLTAIPISYHAARYNIDIDLITRSAGFGYVGSTITSLIYASFSFIFFALEAAIMAQALQLYFGLPLAWGYLLSSLIIIPMTFYGITFINKLQMWTQPVWVTMLFAPFIAVAFKEPDAISAMINFSGTISGDAEFNIYYFGFAIGISLSLIAQIGEQVDYLRFMPPLHKKNRIRWWTAMLLAGPGWIILGFLKQIGGIFLAGLVLLSGFSIYEAKTPIQMYSIGYQYVFDNPEIALAAATLFVITSQIKINVTNAYAGSLAWSNYFSRVTHSHPGRVVWMVFNIAIALLLMELGLFDVLEKVLGLYSNIAIAWIGAITADLIINKPFGLSPKIIEFKRAYLYSFNPVGVGSMGIASIVAIISFIGYLGPMAQSYSSVIAMLLAFFLAPLIAILTRGKYYIAREQELQGEQDSHYNCQICDNKYEKEDMAYCPLHDVNICSLCCSLDSLCHDACKKDSEYSLRKKIGLWLSQCSGLKISDKAIMRILDFISITSLLLFIVAVMAWMVYSSQVEHLRSESAIYLENAFVSFFFIMSILISTLVWWVLLLQESRELAENDLEAQNEALKKSKQALEDQRELYELVFKNTDSCVLIIDIESNKFIDCNEPAIKILKGQSKADILNLLPAQLSPEFQPDGRRSNERSFEIRTIVIEQGSYTFEWQHLSKTNKKFWVEVTLTSIVLDGKKVFYVVWKDIADRKKAEKILQEQTSILDHQAHHDALTKLPNRILFNDRLSHSIERARRNKEELALFFIDLDRFKQINDSLGHFVGDKILQQVSERLQSVIRKEDSLARLGGDEFTILMEDLSKGQDASVLAQKILQSLSEPFYVDEHTLYISSSIGISLFPQDETNIDKLLMFADTAMYKAKDEGRNNFQFYSSEMTLLAVEQVTIIASLRNALENNEFFVFYQPQFNAKNNTIIGLEALIRWQHPTLGLVPPSTFIPLAEETGLIIEIDQWVMTTAMQQVRQWYNKGFKPGVLALNLAMKQLHKKDFVALLEKLLMETPFKPQWLELEITEGKIMTNPEDAINILKQISQLGIQLAVDDFGTGYSSLSYLKRLPIDKLKIDQSFIRDLPDDNEDVAISRAIIALAKSLNLSVIAEGVETKAQKDFLVANGCANIQGYFYGKPMPAAEMENILFNKINNQNSPGRLL